MNFLKNGKACLYAPDQDYGYKGSIFVDFFGNKALTVKFPFLAAKRANCDVYLFSTRKKGFRYHVALEKLLLKKENVKEDLKIMNSKIEEYILSNPENYLWFHRRFKNRPESEAPFYPSFKKKNLNLQQDYLLTLLVYKKLQLLLRFLWSYFDKFLMF